MRLIQEPMKRVISTPSLEEGAEERAKGGSSPGAPSMDCTYYDSCYCTHTDGTTSTCARWRPFLPKNVGKFPSPVHSICQGRQLHGHHEANQQVSFGDPAK